MTKDDVCVIIPARNEEQTIRKLIRTITTLGYRYVWVIDDSTDNTSIIAKDEGAVVVLGRDQGLGGAIRYGLIRAIEAKFSHAVVIDAGGTHDPEVIHNLVSEATNGADLVIASRFLVPCKSQGWRTKLSLLAAKCVRVLLGIPVCDATSGFRCYNLSVFNDKILLDCIANGHATQIELLAFCHLNGGVIKETSSDYLPLTNSSLSLWSFIETIVVMYRMFVLIRIFGNEKEKRHVESR